MKKFFPHFSVLLSIGFLLPQLSRAQIGNDNPTGVTGEYNGSITTAGSYDPYTGNAKRFVDDLTVTGSVGAYPLKYTRVLNSRGGWTHSYAWGLWVKPYQYYHYYPDQYEGPGAMVNYPDGRIETFAIAQEPYTYDPNSLSTEPQDVLEHMGGGNFDLVMRDGGRVKFTHPAGSTSGFDLRATQIVDPYGQITTLTYDGSSRVSQITEPGGRYFQINYNDHGAIGNVQAFDGPAGNLVETVSYTYSLQTLGGYSGYHLTQVNYDDGSQAIYTYIASNTGSVGALVHTCDDVRFAGPMKQIKYEYMPAGGPYDVSWGQIKAERNFSSDQVVSQLSPVPYEPTHWTAAHFQRTETRGDGATRLFQYGNDGCGNLKSYTDFKGQTTQIDYPNTAPFTQYRKSVTDARGNTTSVDRDGWADVVRTIIHPTPDNSTQPSTQQFTYTNYFYLASKTDERTKTTSYTRDGNNRITDISYPDGATEHFTYNPLGQILTHRMTSGGTETFTYDDRGLKTSYYPPPTCDNIVCSDPNPQDHPTRYYYYQGGINNDRLWYVVDPRGNATWYEYNGRGEVTKVTHQDGTYTQSGYNDDGTLAWTADENHPNAGIAGHENERTRYIYDEYKRVLTVTNLLNETTTNYYGLDWANPLVHTTHCVKYTLSPMNKNVVYEYDNNFRKTYQGVALGTDDGAATYFDYDEVGNLNWTKDPRGNVTTFGYDARNRKIWMDDPIASDRNSSGHTMNWEYDGVGNKTKEIRADDAFRGWDYDSMNRLWHAIDWRMSSSDPAITTTYSRDQQDLTEWITDAKGAA